MADFAYDSQKISADIKEAVIYLKEAAKLPPGSLLVLGCSTSEVAGGIIGKNSIPELGEAIAKAMIDACESLRLIPAFQCCEHLNRAIVIEKSELKSRGYTEVRAIPMPKAGGSVPAAAWQLLGDPALAQAITADAGLDIGDTLIGMHIRPVAVPVRCDIHKIGAANLVMAYSRPPYIGGSRAIYE